MDTDIILALQNVTKRFGELVAVDNVNFELKTGEIHAILGENGAGKSTLMNLIYGLYQPSDGSIYISNKSKIFKSPRDAIANGIGMVHQHFMLIENLTVAENIALSVARHAPKVRNTDKIAPDTESLSTKKENHIKLRKFRYIKNEATQITDALSKKYGLAVDPNSLVRNLSVGLKQRVEILKALAVDAHILILDEPTAVLSPQEVTGLFEILRILQSDNRSILFISHKMKEVLDISDRITVLRQGKKVYHGKTGELSDRGLATEMLGEEITEIDRKANTATTDIVLDISDLTVIGSRDEIAVRNISLQTFRGEIVGIAGVDGNGQRELSETIMGLHHIASGKIEILGIQLSGTKNIRKCGVGYIPEDRRTMGIITSFSIAENLMLNIFQFENLANWGVISKQARNIHAMQLIDNYDIRPPFINIPARMLSGGNQQKIVLAREISQQPELLVAVNPTRGLDISAAKFVHQNILAQRNQKKSVLLISTELDEVLQISDRLFVISRGELIDATEHRGNIEKLGLLMTGESKTDV